MNNPAIPSAVSRLAATDDHAFLRFPTDPYFLDSLQADEYALYDDPFEAASFDVAPPAMDAGHPAESDAPNDAETDPASLSAQSPFSSDAVLTALPPILRIQSLTRALDHDKIVNRAVLSHRGSTLCVDWISQHVDTRLYRHGLARIRPATTSRCADGATRIQRLVPVTSPTPLCNLFDTLLPGWVKDAELVARASALWESLPRPLAHLLNAVLWDAERLHRFVTGPSSIRGHHNDLSGNFRHSIEVAERARDLGLDCPLANTPLLVAGGLLHDAAKAAEYRYDRRGRRFRLSDRGQLVGHRDTLIEWLAVARHAAGVSIDEATWLGLLHMLNAVRGAPGWLGLREPRSLEAELLAMADRLSGHQDLHQRCRPNAGKGGFGGYHAHLGHRTYVTQELCS